MQSLKASLDSSSLGDGPGGGPGGGTGGSPGVARGLPRGGGHGVGSARQCSADASKLLSLLKSLQLFPKNYFPYLSHCNYFPRHFINNNRGIELPRPRYGLKSF